jgi:hypothetical protein
MLSIASGLLRACADWRSMVWHLSSAAIPRGKMIRSEFPSVSSIWLRFMALFRRLVFVGLFACAVPVSWIQAQSSANLLPPLPLGQVAPSDSAIQSGASFQSGLVAVKKNTQKSSGVSNVRSTLASGSVPGKSRGLCFQPGIGWQRLPQSFDSSAQKTSLVGSSTATETGAPPLGSNSGTANALPSGAGQANLDQCPGIMASATAPAAVVETMVTGEQSKAANSNLRTTNANFGAQDWLNVNTLLNPASSTASTRLTMGLSSSLSISKHFSQGTEPNPSADSVQEFEAHAYVSPIKLRTMMRSAPDLETRLKLQRLSEEQKKRSGKSTDKRSLPKNKENQSMSNNASASTDLGSHPDQ